MHVAEQILLQYWGYSAFKPFQKQVIDEVIAQKHVLAMLPTGAGKSVCYQIPALLLEGVTLVISPLVALMQDQTQQLSERNIPALQITGNMSSTQLHDVMNEAASGSYKLLYVSPERLQSKQFQQYLSMLNLSMLVIDEAHCISQWGYDFRPAYTKINSVLHLFVNKPILAVTASATPEVQQDILAQLRFIRNKQTVIGPFVSRNNLVYEAININDKRAALLQQLKQLQGINQKVIIYCSTRRETQDISSFLENMGILNQFYHAGLPLEKRKLIQDNFTKGVSNIIVSTSAFGMGIDVPDIGVVIHYTPPESIESYYQEAGRAGRNGESAKAILLYNNTDLIKIESNIEKKYPSIDVLKKIYEHLFNYLGIAAGTGTYETKVFDIKTFVQNFKLDVLQTQYVLQLLSTLQIIQLNDAFSKSTKVWVTVTSRYTIDELSRYNADSANVLNALLRLYEGISFSAQTISVGRIAIFMQTTVTHVLEHLNTLHRMQFIHYEPALNEPSITLLQNRMHAHNFSIDYSLVRKLKQQAQNRFAAFKKFIQNTEDCKQVQLATYFGEKNTQPCLNCNICNERTATVNIVNENELIKKTVQLLQLKPHTLTDLLRQLQVSEKEIVNVLQYLRSEEQIFFNASSQQWNVK